MDRIGWLKNIWQDLRYAARQLRLNPGFAAVAVLSLGLGVGANTAIFQLLDAVRLRTLPVANPQELAYINLAKGSMRSGWFSTRSARLTYTQWEQIRTLQQSFSGTMGWSASRLFVPADFFGVLGVQPMLGRGFTPEDDQPGCGSPSAVVSHAFWQREL